MKKIRLIYLIVGVFLLFYLFLYHPNQSLRYMSNFNAEKTIVGRFILAPINIKLIAPPKIKYYCGERELEDRYQYEQCNKMFLHKNRVTPIKDQNLLLLYYSYEQQGLIGQPVSFDDNRQPRKKIARYETFALLILSLFFLWRKRFKATEALCKFYNKI